MLYIVFCFTCTKVKGSSTSLKDFIAKNGQVNAVTMKDVVDACCNAKRKNIDGAAVLCVRMPIIRPTLDEIDEIDPRSTSIVCQGLCHEGQNQGTFEK